MTVLDTTQPLLCFVWNPRDEASLPPVSFDSDAWDHVDLLQIRGKTLSDGALERISTTCVSALSGDRTRIIVNDRLDVAMASGADGVHLGTDDLPIELARQIVSRDFLVGVSTHDRAELYSAQAAGASYAGLGAFRASETKTDAVGLDLAGAGLDSPLGRLEIPVLAIGGVDVASVETVFCVEAVTGVAVSAAIETARDPAAVIVALRQALDAAWDHRAKRVLSR